ncbi:MAG TPA: bifunctional diaminohydroxyphosphoribosylaminopyrimidine deaminase/5-amino-6-(5-phosphoribosylamino)uracil reductase RibD [Vicinamibacteria bacterium]|nr:bifunctional diaminohydroxyphosphoribosylaminopyrimidine deaminase/5-amino-6-(5-phosphoribosylamino)uracil reductase RibD [Vicinamibacteria bacterium]
MSDVRFMRRALALARWGEGETNPNPMVGCVVVRDGRIVGEGFHSRAGGPHAEALALERAGERARGATLYVNLEPCSHRGRTPPCAPQVALSGVRRVVAAMRDPNPLVRGRGLRLLRRRGVRVDVGVLEGAAARLNERFVTAARLDRPFVLLKAAVTLDGRIATARGDSKWITSAAQRAAARGLRRLHDAVLVGIETVLADDPLLLPKPRTRRPFVRIVLDSRLRLPVTSRVVRTARREPVWVLCCKAAPSRRRALQAAGVVVLEVGGRATRVPLRRALRLLRSRAIWSVMVEGGSEVLGAFLHERLFDQLALFRAPLLLGGRGSRPAFGGPDPPRIADALRLRPGMLPRGASYELWYAP